MCPVVELAIWAFKWATKKTAPVLDAVSVNIKRSVEPQVGIEPTTARLRIECSTPELLWQRTELHALARIRTATPCGTTPSRWRVYQFHHQGNNPATGPTGLEPATSRVTVECSNQLSYGPSHNRGSRDDVPSPNPISSPTPFRLQSYYSPIARTGVEPVSAP